MRITFILRIIILLSSFSLSADVIHPVKDDSRTTQNSYFFDVSECGTSFEIYNKIIHFESVTQSDWDTLWQSFAYSGVIVPLTIASSIRSGIYFYRYFGQSTKHWLSYAALIAAGYFYIDAVLSRLLTIQNLILGLLELERPAPLIATGVALLSIASIEKGDYLGTFFNSKLYILMPLAVVMVRLAGLNSDQDDQPYEIRHLALSGNAARHFVITAAFERIQNNQHLSQEMPEMATYGLDRIHLDSDYGEGGENDPDSYSRLAHVMDDLNLVSLILDRQVSENQEIAVLGERASDRKLVMSGNIILENNQASKWFNPHMTDEDTRLRSVDRFMLSPDVIGAIADYMESKRTLIYAYTKPKPPSSSDDFIRKMEDYVKAKVGKTGTYEYYNYDIFTFSEDFTKENLGVTLGIDYSENDNITTFLLPGAQKELAAKLRFDLNNWNIALHIGHEGQEDNVEQYISPLWFNRIVFTCLKSIGPKYIYSWVSEAIDYWLPLSNVIYLNQMTEYEEENTNEDTKCSTCYAVIKGSVAAKKAMEKTPKNHEQHLSPDTLTEVDTLLKTHCGHIFCPSCIDKIRQTKISRASDSWNLINFHINCPYCRNSIH
ncbi:RING finger protein [Endozoicomonas numazuensis]|uniref:RING-type domain-containing protein n=1 Tax=Endozoicomonas numazuensis TaxID=1137799 RepID=A0A081N3Z2_9GAMM|nr:hypothetical protein [Endozoicomonas numazuensis]KEQ13165.1 hypothetical protein GZ78_26860 [Endozoicomonas numazuensis]